MHNYIYIYKKKDKWVLSSLGVDLEGAKRLEEDQIMADARTWLQDGLPADVRHPRTGATPLHVSAAKGYLEAIK